MQPDPDLPVRYAHFRGNLPGRLPLHCERQKDFSVRPVQFGTAFRFLRYSVETPFRLRAAKGEEL